MRTTIRLIAFASLGLVLGATPAHAAGPLIMNGAGQPLLWSTATPIPFHPDRGKLGDLTNATAVAEVAAQFGVWAAVPTTAVTFVNAGALPEDVTADEVLDYFGICDGYSSVIFDEDGSITDALTGGANFVLGFATPECGDFVPNEIVESFVVLNGRFLDGINLGTANPEFTLAGFRAVMVHEFGHYLNLDHSQINLLEAFDGDPGNDAAVATMFPFTADTGEGTSLHLDDRVAISRLYPAPSFASAFGTIAGSIFQFVPTAAFQGAYVIARKLDDPRLTAVGAASGDLYFPSQPGGPPPPSLEGAYVLPGLPPGGYTLELEEIDARFQTGSSVGPFDVPVSLGGPPEFWNGANESGTNPPDDPTDLMTLAVTAGATLAVDMVINEPDPPPNDDCADATVATGLDFAELLFTSGATTEPSDPLQSCTEGGPSQNIASVWYRFTPPTDGNMVADSRYIAVPPLPGEPYDTVVTVHTGTCGALTEIACNDGIGRILQGAVGVDVSAAETYYVNFTGRDGSDPERLRARVRFTPDSPICPDPRGIRRMDFKVKKLGLPFGDEQMRVSLTVDPPLFTEDTGVIDPLANGLQLFVEDEYAGWTPYFVLASTDAPSSAIPPGGIGTGCGPKDGWKSRSKGRRFDYVNKSGALPAAGCAPGSAEGLTNVTVKISTDDRGRRTVKVSFKTKNSTLDYPIPGEPGTDDYLLRTAVSFSASDGNVCGQLTHHCHWGPNQQTMACRLE
jgi:hypothetical protein